MTSIAHLICEALRANGIDKLFCLPGVQNDDFFDVLFDYPDIRPIVTRHEQGAAYMATGAAMATGGLAAYCIAPGQGLLNAAAAHSTAFACGARVLGLIGEAPSGSIGAGHGMLHEIPNQMEVLARISKHTENIRDAAHAEAQVCAVFDALTGGHPAPAAMDCPIDVWAAPLTFDPAMKAAPARPKVDEDAVAAAAKALANSKSPLIVAGGGAFGVTTELRQLAEMLQAPVALHRMGKGALDARHPLAVPFPVAHKLWAKADVVLAVGSRLQMPEMAWGVDDDLTIIKITADPAEVNRRGVTDLPICALTEDVMPLLLEKLAARLGKRADRTAEVAGLMADFRAEIAHLEPQLSHLHVIRDALGEDGVLVEDLTQVGFVGRFAYPAYSPRTYLSPGYAGTLGWGYPAALGAQAALPDRRVLSLQGDGGFMYCANELATAVKHNIPLVALVYNDGAYGNVKRIQQERFGHNRTIASDLTNPDFVKYAESFGAMGLRAEGAEGLRDALETAFEARVPAVIEIPVTEPFPSPWPHIMLKGGRGRRIDGAFP
jgi:acetolactate synthase-1/2/3 large subunit